MDIQTLTTLISTVGFPIVCVIFMWKYIATTMKEVSKAIDNNTLAITELKTLVNEKLKE